MLLDTSGLLCFFHEREPGHAEAVRHFSEAARRVTHNYVLAEFIPLCRARGVNPVGAIEFAEELLGNAESEIVWVDESLHRAALQLLQARPDKDYSLCDAVSFIVMRQVGVNEELTTDHHFEQEGFVRLLGP